MKSRARIVMLGTGVAAPAAAVLLACLAATIAVGPVPVTLAAAKAGESAAAQAELAFDLEQMVDGLTKTSAIGGFAKLSLKGKVEDLLRRVVAYHRGSAEHGLDQLRERYDVLVNKVLVMLQDRDDALAGRIAAARHQLWEHLADAERFAKLSGAL